MEIFKGDGNPSMGCPSCVVVYVSMPQHTYNFGGTYLLALCEMRGNLMSENTLRK